MTQLRSRPSHAYGADPLRITVEQQVLELDGVRFVGRILAPEEFLDIAQRLIAIGAPGDMTPARVTALLALYRDFLRLVFPMPWWRRLWVPDPVAIFARQSFTRQHAAVQHLLEVQFRAHGGSLPQEKE